MYDCELCGDHRLYQEDSYRQHISEAHAGSLEEDMAGECACPTCGDVFGSYGLLTRHVANVHSVVVCGICTTSFSNEQELIEHKNTHHLEKSFSCPDCLEVMPDEKTLKDHSDVCSKMIFPCDLCNAEFANYSYLEKHKAQAHPQETAEHVEFTVEDSSSDEESVDDNVPAANVGIKMELLWRKPHFKDCNCKRTIRRCSLFPIWIPWNNFSVIRQFRVRIKTNPKVQIKSNVVVTKWARKRSMSV
nr:zinc finger protein 728-like [Aedes albopictus]